MKIRLALLLFSASLSVMSAVKSLCEISIFLSPLIDETEIMEALEKKEYEFKDELLDSIASCSNLLEGIQLLNL